MLDTETTGLEVDQDHRIIEIGCVELVNRHLTGRHFHCYLNPERDIDAGATEVHGIRNEDLVDQPRFGDILADFLGFIEGAELVIHNAPFDLGFLNRELARLAQGQGRIEDRCTVVDTLAMARQLHPGQKNSLDALCKRYAVNNAERELHGALLDAEILADVYLLMTGGQTTLVLEGNPATAGEASAGTGIRRLASGRPPLRVLTANPNELAAHRRKLTGIDQASGGRCRWLKTESGH